jgi:hypothetical protein
MTYDSSSVSRLFSDVNYSKFPRILRNVYVHSFEKNEIIFSLSLATLF